MWGAESARKFGGAAMLCHALSQIENNGNVSLQVFVLGCLSFASNKKLLGTKGNATRSKKLLVLVAGITTSNKKLLSS